MDVAANPLIADALSAADAPADALPPLPDFARITPAHFGPALTQAMALHRQELDAIAADPAPASFANTAAALDRSGAALARVSSVLHNLTASNTTPELQAVQRDTAGPLAAHEAAVEQHPGVYARLQALEAPGVLDGASAEQRRLVQRQLSDARRAGAHLGAAERAELATLAERLGQLNTAFAQNVLHDEAAFTLPLADESALAGLPDFLRQAAQAAADERGLPQPVITLSRSLIVPFLSFSSRRDLRETAWRAWVGRGEQPGAHDNRALVSQILAARQRQAALMGYPSYADYKLVDTMAGTRQRVWALLDEVWQRALPALDAERQLLRQAMAEAGETAPLQAWDWRFWAERVRQQRYALDEAALKPYFPLPAMVNAAFECAEKLFGLRFERRHELHGYHPDVAVYEVRAPQRGLVGLFLHDNFARAAKRSGAWMSTLQVQHRNGLLSRPVVLNNNPFAKAAGKPGAGADAGAPTLLSPDDVRTLFHELGHGLHGLLSDVGYARLSGTAVLRDFVELPSQLYEHWGTERAVLARHARHWRTGEPLPAEAIDRIEAARKFGQGYETVRYTASAIIDLAAHERPEGVADIDAFERTLMAARGLPADTGMNHRLPHFQHLFSGSGYAAGYYVYLWAEVLEADAWEAFVEAGDPFDTATAQRLHDCILSRGDSVDPGEAFRAFRGRDPQIEPMLRGRGLID